MAECGWTGGTTIFADIGLVEGQKTCYFSDAYGAPLLTFVQSLKNNEFWKYRAGFLYSFSSTPFLLLPTFLSRHQADQTKFDVYDLGAA